VISLAPARVHHMPGFGDPVRRIGRRPVYLSPRCTGACTRSRSFSGWRYDTEGAESGWRWRSGSSRALGDCSLHGPLTPSTSPPGPHYTGALVAYRWCSAISGAAGGDRATAADHRARHDQGGLALRHRRGCAIAAVCAGCCGETTRRATDEPDCVAVRRNRVGLRRFRSRMEEPAASACRVTCMDVGVVMWPTRCPAAG